MLKICAWLSLRSFFFFSKFNRRQPKHKSLSLIRRYNRHAAIVIGAHPSGAANEAESMQVTAAEKSKEGRVSEAVRLPDLEMNAAQDVAQLRIKDPRLYFEACNSSL